jgi:predicted Zn-dependent protease
MKGTLFHEVGHALGLAHNFKGSLSFDRSKADSIFSNSIMDYNDYEIERQVFKDDSSEGPLLEYDRQVLSALYNNMKDVKASDPRVAVCNDAEADTEEAGAVDPTCMRYDIEKDPTLSIETALKRLKEDALEGDVSLVQALQNMQKMVLSEEAIQAVNSEEALMNLLRKLASDLTGVLRFYHLSGKASLVSTVRSNLKSLRPFIDESIGDLSELGMRTRALNGLKATLEMKSLSENVQKQILALAEAAGEEIKKSPFALATGGGDAIATNVKVLLSTFGKRFERDSRAGLPRVRSAILARLGHVEGLPFFFGNAEGTELDIESQITGILAQTAGDLTASMNERLYSARSLKTFSGRPGVNAMISNLRSQIERELKSARSHDEREVLILMQRLLGGI